MDRIQLGVVSYSVTDSLEKTILQVTAQDLPVVVRQVAAIAIAEQISLKNVPTSIVVDNKARTPITEAKFRVQAFFANTDDIRRAVYEAWDKITSLTRVATGRGVSSYELWFNEQKIGKSPAAAEMVLPRFKPGVDYFRIVGPVVVYGRKLYWNPKGKPRFSKRTVLKTKTTAFKLVRIRGIMNLTEQFMRRRFRMLAIAEDWVVTSALPKDGRTPGLYIGFKKRGSTLSRFNNG